MGYRVARHWNNENLWRVIWRRYELDSKSGKYKAKERHIPQEEYAKLGIRREMTLPEARSILNKLNAEERIRQREDQRNQVAIRLSRESEIECAHLPRVFVEKFETEHLSTRYLGNDERLHKVLKMWRAAQRIIRTIKQPVEKWHRYPEHFYSYFEKNEVSPGYAKNILSVINMWLDFLGAEQDKLYRPVPAPNNVWQSRINTAFEEADKSKASCPISPEQLESARSRLSPEHYNWIYCTVWAGLRPNEANALLNPKRTRIRFDDMTPILEIYQSKLKNVPKTEDRWKFIPLFLPEQRRILEIIESKAMKCPLPKTVSLHLGGATLYGGRKGFHELMVTRFSQPELEVVRWLGHRSLDMAMKHYAKRDSVRWNPVTQKSA